MMIQYVADDTIHSAFDQEIRTLLTTCFTGAHDAVFHHQRYFAEPYPHRWIVRNAENQLVAHIGVHDKKIETEGVPYRIGGICEVSVHPDARGQGLTKKMFIEIHRALEEWKF
ncbi:MAG: GNAT family N-acetyltransferase, partial [Verrucomicrobiota bacterium]